MALPSTIYRRARLFFLQSFMIQVHNYIQLKNIFEDENRVDCISATGTFILKTNAI